VGTAAILLLLKCGAGRMEGGVAKNKIEEGGQGVASWGQVGEEVGR